MSDRKTGESLEQYAIRTCWELGHFWGPDNPDGWNVRQSDLKSLKVSDPIVVQALRSMSEIDTIRYSKAVIKHHHRLPMFDGTLGPAMRELLEDPYGRCPIPDYAPPPGVVFAFDDPQLQQVVERMQDDTNVPDFLVRSGNWPRCHGVGDFHCANVQVDEANLPSHVRPLFKRILAKVQLAYRQVGLLFNFYDPQGTDYLTGKSLEANVNIKMSFVRSSAGWIGLAIVGKGQRCGDQIWCQFLSTYTGGRTDEDIITQWVTLILHELGHNCGLSHSRGGIMNPSLITGLLGYWALDDPSRPTLVDWFGGVLVPMQGDDPAPDPPTPPTPIPADVQTQLNNMNLRLAVQEAWLGWCTDQIRKRGVL